MRFPPAHNGGVKKQPKTQEQKPQQGKRQESSLEQDEQKCEAVLRSHPALNDENRSRVMILGRFDPKSS